MIRAGHPRDQAIAASLRNAGIAAHVHRAMGGGLSMSMDSPWWTRSEARDMEHPSGFINSSVPGRTDRLPLAVGTDSHIIPADVVSGLGQGNSLAGADMWERALKIGPYGMPAQSSAPPRPHFPSAPSQPHYAHGGRMAKTGAPRTPIMAAGGELVVPEWRVREIGGGNMKRGHDLIDQAIDRVRKMNIEFLKNAPKPKK